MDGKEFSSPINADIVKKYYAWGHMKKHWSELKTRKGGFGWKKKKKKFKVKTRKGNLNQKKWKVKLKTWKRWLDYKGDT